MATPRQHQKKQTRKDGKFNAFLRFRKAHPDGTLFKAVPYKDEEGKEINGHHFFRLSFDQAGFDMNRVAHYLGKGYQIVEVYMNDTFKAKYGRGKVSGFDEHMPPNFREVLNGVGSMVKFSREKYEQDLAEFQPGDQDYDINSPNDADIADLAKSIKESAHKKKLKEIEKDKETKAAGATA